MDDLLTLDHHHPHPAQVQHRDEDSATSEHEHEQEGGRDDWEDWEDDDDDDDGTTTITNAPSTPGVVQEAALIDLRGSVSTSNNNTNSNNKPITTTTVTTTKSSSAASASASASAARQSSAGPKIRRLKSRQRQKAQNAKVGIKLETDMSKFRERQQQQQHVAQQMKPERRERDPDRDSREGKFVDVAALRALEGEPSSASVGSFAWLKKKQPAAETGKIKKSKKAAAAVVAAADVERKGGQASSSSVAAEDDEEPIIIGFTVPDDSRDVVGSTQKKTKAIRPPSPTMQRSVWSPDTEDGVSPFRSPKRVSSYFSTPPKKQQQQETTPAASNSRRRTTLVSDDDDDAETPVTPFQEDSSPILPPRQKSAQTTTKTKKSRPRVPTDSSTRSRGWWDQVTTPFDAVTPGSAGAGVGATNEWWKGRDEKHSQSQSHSQSRAVTGAGHSTSSSSSSSAPVQIQRDLTRTRSPSRSSSSNPSRAEGYYGSDNQEKMDAHNNNNNNNNNHHHHSALAAPDEPPPYTPPEKKQAIRYRAVFPPGHPLGAEYPPSPGPVSPELGKTMGGARDTEDIRLGDVPASAPDRETGTADDSFQDVPLPERPAGTYLPDAHGVPITGHGPRQETERRRRRHEKEDVVARRIGGAWRGRNCCCCGCIPAVQGYFSRPGREGRKRRRIALAGCGVLLAVVVILAVVLGVLLTHKAAAEKTPAPLTTASATGAVVVVAPPASQWFNLTEFPPIYTGISTVVGADNTQNETAGCAMPSTMWSCSLPKEQQAANQPYQADQPSFVFQIQYDNGSQQLWNVGGQAPTPTVAPPAPSPSSVLGQGVLGQNGSATSGNLSASSQLGGSGDGALSNLTQGVLLRRRGRGGAVGVLDFLRSVVRDLSGRGDDAASPYDPGFAPDPPPPSFDEYWFLGNTTDGVVADEKAGEATPFYVSVLRSVNESVGPDVLTRRSQYNNNNNNNNYNNRERPKRDAIDDGNGAGHNTTAAKNLTAILPPPDLNTDGSGTGAPAQMLPFPYQQPLRLFDRGLPTEHYGFYSYFNRTIYVQSVANRSGAEDSDGGSPESAARWVVTWSFTRYKVAMWTRMTASTAQLLSPPAPAAATPSSSAAVNATTASEEEEEEEALTTRPGTFPYPVTVTLDLHGGPVGARQAWGFAYAYGINADGTVDVDSTAIVSELVAGPADTGSVGSTGTGIVNAYTDPNLSYGGIDGGTGLCSCAWQNWEQVQQQQEEEGGGDFIKYFL